MTTLMNGERRLLRETPPADVARIGLLLGVAQYVLPNKFLASERFSASITNERFLASM